MKRNKGCANVALQLEPRRMKKAEILAFATAFDPQPAHLDEHAAQETPLHGLCASGWHTCAVIAYALEEVLARVPGYAGNTGVDDLRWLQPVRPGDKLFARVVLEPPVECACGNAAARRPARIEARNQWGVDVLRWSSHVVLGGHCARAIASACAFRMPRKSRVGRRTGEHLIKYFEDIHCGDEIELGGYSFTPESTDVFESVVVTRIGKRGAAHARAEAERISGWHLIAGWMKLITGYYDRRATRLIAANLPVPRLGPAIGLRWLRWLVPVSLGEKITFRAWVEHKIDAVGPSQWGLLVAGAEGHNERGEVVISFYPQFLLERHKALAS